MTLKITPNTFENFSSRELTKNVKTLLKELRKGGDLKISINERGDRYLVCATTYEIAAKALLKDVEPGDVRSLILRTHECNLIDSFSGVLKRLNKILDDLLDTKDKVFPLNMTVDAQRRILRNLQSGDLIAFGLSHEGTLDLVVEILLDKYPNLVLDRNLTLFEIVKNAYDLLIEFELERGRDVLFAAIKKIDDRWLTFDDMVEDSNRDSLLAKFEVLSLKNPDDGKNMRLPPEIGLFKNLKRLICPSARLLSIPPEIGSCTALTHLDVQNNLLKGLPNDLQQCVQLESLDVRDNKLKRLPSTIVNCRSLIALDVGSNFIEALPDNIGALTSLFSLRIGNNRIKALPSTIINCSKLVEIAAENNDLEHLPDGLTNCTNLERLYLRNNRLKSLPNELGQCVELRTLDVYGNKLTDFPDLSLCKQLISDFDGNPLDLMQTGD